MVGQKDGGGAQVPPFFFSATLRFARRRQGLRSKWDLNSVERNLNFAVKDKKMAYDRPKIRNLATHEISCAPYSVTSLVENRYRIL